MRDPLFYWHKRSPFVYDTEGTKTDMKTCTKCSGEIKKSEKFIKITVNGEVTYRHDRKCV